jgi:hypothetical protein
VFVIWAICDMSTQLGQQRGNERTGGLGMMQACFQGLQDPAAGDQLQAVALGAGGGWRGVQSQMCVHPSQQLVVTLVG